MILTRGSSILDCQAISHCITVLFGHVSKVSISDPSESVRTISGGRRFKDAEEADGMIPARSFSCIVDALDWLRLGKLLAQQRSFRLGLFGLLGSKVSVIKWLTRNWKIGYLPCISSCSDDSLDLLTPVLASPRSSRSMPSVPETMDLMVAFSWDLTPRNLFNPACSWILQRL